MVGVYGGCVWISFTYNQRRVFSLDWSVGSDADNKNFNKYRATKRFFIDRLNWLVAHRRFKIVKVSTVFNLTNKFNNNPMDHNLLILNLCIARIQREYHFQVVKGKDNLTSDWIANVKSRVFFLWFYHKCLRLSQYIYMADAKIRKMLSSMIMFPKDLY